MKPDRIDALKDLHLATDLTGDVAVVVPEDPAWREVSDRLVSKLTSTSRSAGRAEATEDGVWDLLRDSHVVVVGNAMSTPAAMGLYKRRFAQVDAFYPGGDGYDIRTVHNPDNVGHNVLLVGASRPAGAAAGLEALHDLLTRTDGRPGYTNLSRSSTHEALLPSVAPDAFREQMEAAYRGNALRGPIEQGVTMGLTHHLTGDVDCARMFLDVLFYYESLVHGQHAGEWCFEHMLFIYAWTWRLFHTWDLIEESDAFSDDERLRMTNLLWGLTHYVGGLTYFRGAEPSKEVAGSAVLRWQPEIRQNHATFAAMSMSASAGYFQTYYGLGGFEDQMAVCEAIFDGQADCYKPNDDGGGGGYCWLVPNHLMTYDFRRGRERFLRGGHLRRLADYAVLITDNLGSLVGFGDVGSYGRRRTSSPGVASVLCRAAWYYDEGGYLWALRWMGGSPVHECYYRELAERVPEWLTGVAVAPFNRPLYEWVERHGPGGANVPADEAFDKLTVRSGFEEDDFYLLLDGTSTFAHGHDDGNSIERLTWKGRMWLAETDYIWRRPRHHSSVVSICDGESGEMPSLAGLKWAETFDGISVTRTVVPDYNGLNWTRDVVWLDGRSLFVTDSLDLLKDADYDVRCLWRTLGDVRLEADGLHVAQRGVHFRILQADDARASLEVEHPRVTGQDPYAAYDFADGPIRILKERYRLHGAPGDRLRYGNLMVAGSDREVRGGAARRLAEGLFETEDGNGRCLVGFAEDGTTLGLLEIRAPLFVLHGACATLLRAEGFHAGDAGFSAGRPVHAHVDLTAGRATLRALEETTVTFTTVPDLRVDGTRPEEGGGRAKVRLSPGEHTVEFRPQTDTPLSLAAIPDVAYQSTPRPVQCCIPGSPGDLPMVVAWQADVGAPVTALTGAEGRIAVGTAGGRVVLLDADGREAWAHDTGGAVRALHAGRFGDGVVLTGGRDGALSLLDAAGRPVWRRPFDRSHGRDQIVNAVTVADLTGDGEVRAVVATDGWLVWALDPSGEAVWQRQIEHHAARSLVVDDVDGDGLKEILVGTEYYNSNLLEADGRIRWTIRGGPGFEALALTDLDGDGLLEALYGSMDGCIYAFEPGSGRLLWTRNLGDNVTCGYPTAEGFAAGSESGNVALIAPDGGRRWRLDLGDAVSGLCPIAANGDDCLVAGTVTGSLAMIGLDGKVKGAAGLQAPVSAMGNVPVEGGARLVVGTETGKLLVYATR